MVRTPGSITEAEIYFGEIRHSKINTAERRLALAVLEQAIRDYERSLLAVFGHKGAYTYARELIRECEEWFSNRSHSYTFHFENVCDWLDIKPDYLRNGLVYT